MPLHVPPVPLPGDDAGVCRVFTSESDSPRAPTTPRYAILTADEQAQCQICQTCTLAVPPGADALHRQLCTPLQYSPLRVRRQRIRKTTTAAIIERLLQTQHVPLLLLAQVLTMTRNEVAEQSYLAVLTDAQRRALCPYLLRRLASANIEIVDGYVCTRGVDGTCVRLHAIQDAAWLRTGSYLQFTRPVTRLTCDELHTIYYRVTTIRSCIIRHVQWYTLPRNFCTNFTGLRALHLEELGLEWLPPEFCDLHSLTVLNVAYNKLTYIPTGVFPHLTHLRCNNNWLPRLPACTAPRLVHLDAASNRISSVLTDDIAGYPRLQFIQLSSNRLVEFPYPLLQLPALLIMHVQYNTPRLRRVDAPCIIVA